MILALRFTFIVEKSWKIMYFHPKLAWPTATYNVISRNHSNWISMKATELVSKFARGMKEQLLKTSGADVLSSGKKLRKTSGRGGIHSLPLPPPLPTHLLYGWGLTCTGWSTIWNTVSIFIGSLNAKTASLCMICTSSSGAIWGFHNRVP